ncbi:tRNA-specific adenosine deaminase [Wolbachia endosymbiont of Cylisticus convexus]|nr:tRNA-specific adenosine deaminase [Wolbachia endosymbiont of Armadillidium vulgare]OJH32043.1 tRNA-specific adenosine deaminase [Wolbachia endosymbiont of Armadillidium vulgare]OJH32600.1 tRNA-specific adenosine deaminase [Wolbachia endosymbiont of Armadillidium vulgare]OJH33222.1 tRNA-specific adenosine deaminase [Wolbachia endosymbiont of Armadillidium vulgare]RDD35505.1 tRNA-specific adenosine deaminase [Wolbachia endosymbiont of Cylisticus convexus]
MFKYQYMEFAIEQAKLAQKNGEVPIGAVIVSRNNIISSAHNISNDPTAHAEMLTIRKAFSTSVLYDADMYVTLEPCPMCAQAISFARIKRLYFGAYNPKGGGVENGAKIFQFCTHIPEVYGGILETECSLLLKDFFEKLRA